MLDRVCRGAEIVETELVADFLAVPQHSKFRRNSRAIGEPVVLGERGGNGRGGDNPLGPQRIFNALAGLIQSSPVRPQHGIGKFEQFPPGRYADFEFRV